MLRVKVISVAVKLSKAVIQAVGDFELNVDKEFSFDYKIGTVGLNKQAHIITKLHLDD